MITSKITILRINYIILAHKNPRQLRRLIDKLSDCKSHFYVHIDKGVDIRPFNSYFQSLQNIYFLKDNERKLGTWGDIAIVEATLLAMEKINNSYHIGYTVLLTGQDYPLRDPIEISDFFNKNYGKNFISLFSLKDKKWKSWAHLRITHYKINKSTRRGDFILIPSIWDKDFYQRKTLGKLNYLRKTRKFQLLLKIFKKRKFQTGLQAFGGSVYWALPNSTVSKILKYTIENPDYLRYQKFTLCADEIFFHSIIKNIQDYESMEIAPSLTYVNWERKNVSLPVTFTSQDFEELKIAREQKFLFARKFDEDKDAEIFNMIDKLRSS